MKETEDLKEKQQKEALKRMRKIIKMLNLDESYIKDTKLGKYGYTVDNTFPEDALELCFKKLDEWRIQNGALIYYVIFTVIPGLGSVMNILYVGECEQDWDATDVYDDWVYAATYTAEADFWEYGSIHLANHEGNLVRIG